MSDVAPVLLQVGSQIHTGWQEVSIRLSLEQMADEFSLTLTERWTESGEVRPVVPGQACTVKIGNELVLTGYLDEVLPDYDAESHSIVANGRSRAADMVDCSGKEKRLDGRTLVQIATTLAQPYGIEVVDKVGDNKPFKSFVLEDGQPMAEAIERAAQLRSARVVSDAQGRLVIVHAVQREISTVLELGKNIYKASGTFSDRDRFNQYIIEGQTPGDNDWNGTQASSPRGTANDPRVRRPRTTLVVCDTPADSKDCSSRAELEARMRWAKGRGVTYTVLTWTHELGVWRPGDLVHVRDPYLTLDEKMLISDVQLIEGLDGRRAELRVAPPAAFEPVPIKAKDKTSKSSTPGDLGW
ncbi:phage baseplate assembly protein [Pseudomonas putida]|uniref:phage baseplate assembly protein n=1 Tax=Pseudomonas putida TaxID=303 RepID=UPI002DBCDFB5|nr:hypothetical protein [Pseudomonas putida]WRW04673.1 hypothetical protein VPZ82_04430 [Pseudomonas putida]